MASPYEEIAMKLANKPGWVVHKLVAVDNGIICYGAVYDTVTRGKREGRTNWRKKHPHTDRTFLITDNMLKGKKNA